MRPSTATAAIAIPAEPTRPDAIASDAIGSEPQATATALYRPESIASLRSRHGRPAGLMAIGMWALVLLMVALLAIVLLFLALSSYARKETVPGLLQTDAGSSEISYHRPGTIRAVFVREGQMVRKGQPLFAIELDTALDGGGTLGSRLAAANRRQAAELASQVAAAGGASVAEEHDYSARLAGLRSQQAHLRDMAALQRQRLALDRTTLSGLTELQKRGFVSAIRLRDKQSEELAARQAINETERQIDQTQSDAASVAAALERSRSQTSQAQAALRASAAELDQKDAQAASERGVVLVAPSDGRVVTMRATNGKAVTPGTTLAIVLPRDAHLQAELWVPSRAAGFVKAGDEVRLMYDAFPYQRFGSGHGRVVSVSTTPVDPKDVPVAQEAKEALFRVRVALDRQSIAAYGRTWSLAPGSRLSADLILERQSMLSWILDPIRATGARAAS